MKDYLKPLIGFGAAIGILLLFTAWVGWGQIIFAVTNAQLRYVALGAVVAFSGVILLGVSWWIAVRDVIEMGVVEGVKLFFVTFFANAVTPLGQFGGEPFIAYIVSKDADIPVEESLGAIIAADIINSVPFFTLSLTGILVFLIFFPLNSLVAVILKLVVGLALTLITAATIIAVNQKYALSVLGSIGEGLNNLSRKIGVSWGPLRTMSKESMQEKGKNFFSIVHALFQNKRMLLKASIVAHIQALLSPIALYLFLLSLEHLHPAVDVPFSALLFILPASMLAGYLPLPGGLGGIDVAMTALLVTITTVPAAPASVAVLLFRVSTYWAGMILGAYLASNMSVDVLSAQYS